MTDSPHLFCHFLLFHFSLSSHLCPSVPPPLASFSILLLPTHSLPFANRTQSVIPAHSVLGFPPSLRHDPVGHSGPLGLLRVFFLSLLPLCNLGSVGHSGPLSPLLPPYLLSLLSSQLFHHCLDSVSHSGSLGLWPSPLLSLLLPSPFFLGSWFHLSLHPVGHSGPLGSWQPLSLFSHSPCFLCHLSPTSSLPLRLSGSFRPTRSFATFSHFLASTLLPLSP